MLAKRKQWDAAISGNDTGCRCLIGQIGESEMSDDVLNAEDIYNGDAEVVAESPVEVETETVETPSGDESVAVEAETEETVESETPEEAKGDSEEDKPPLSKEAKAFYAKAKDEETKRKAAVERANNLEAQLHQSAMKHQQMEQQIQQMQKTLADAGVKPDDLLTLLDNPQQFMQQQQQQQQQQRLNAYESRAIQVHGFDSYSKALDVFKAEAQRDPSLYQRLDVETQVGDPAEFVYRTGVSILEQQAQAKAAEQSILDKQTSEISELREKLAKLEGASLNQAPTAPSIANSTGKGMSTDHWSGPAPASSIYD